MRKRKRDEDLSSLPQDKLEQLESISVGQVGKPKKRKKEISKTRFWINIVVFAVIGCFCGIFVGNYIVEAFLNKIDYSIYDEATLRAGDDITAIQKKGIASLSAVEAFVLAEYQLTNVDHYIVSSNGKVSNPVKDQTVWSTHKKGGNRYYNSQISQGIKNVAYQMNYTAGDQVVVQAGSPTSGGDADWNGREESMSAKEYKTQWGNSPTGVISYIVGSRTVIEKGTKVKSEQGYECEIQLHTIASVTNYVKQMGKLSGLDSPKFNFIHIKFCIDEQGNFISIDIEEEYKVTYGVTVTCGATLHMQFDFESEVTF